MLAWHVGDEERRLAAAEGAVPDPDQRSAEEALPRRVDRGEEGVPARHARERADHQRTWAETVDQDPCQRREEDSDERKREAAQVVQVDQLEREDEAGAEEVDEDGELEPPDVARQAQRRPK